jgi:putative hemolysin
MLTIEDVLEEIVGDIRDEHDGVAGAIRAAGEGVWVTDPLALLGDLERVTGLKVPSGRYRTLGGYLLHSQGEGWRHGKPIVISPYRVAVEEPTHLGAPRVTIEIQPTEEPEE